MASVEFNWNVFPSTRLEEANMITPLGCMVTPFHSSDVPIATSEPLSCSLCGSYINPHIRIDRPNRTWWCPMCFKINLFPENFKLHERDSSDSEIAPEIRPSESNTIDYIPPPDISSSKEITQNDLIFTYVIDMYQNTDSLDQQEFDSLLQAVIESFAKLPENSSILLITFNEDVQIHQPNIHKHISILTKDMSATGDWFSSLEDNSFFETLVSKLCVSGSIKASTTADLSSLQVLSKPSEALVSYTRALKPKLTRSYKPPRSTGLANLIAVSLCSKFARPFSHGKLMIFLGGPGTVEPGKIVAEKEDMRSHKDIANFGAPHFIPASRFYRALGYIIAGYSFHDAYSSVYSTSGKLVNYSVPDSSPRFSFDIYTGSLDQVGVYEMKALSESCGGNIVMADSFASNYFRASFDLNLKSCSETNDICKLTVSPSIGLKVMKVLAHCTELQSSYQAEKFSALHHEKISDTITKFDSSLMKRNITNQWHLGTVSTSDAFAIFFEMETAPSCSRIKVSRATSEAVIQLLFKYWSMSRRAMMLRIVTIKRPTTIAITAPGKSMIYSENVGLARPRTDIAENNLMRGFNSRVWMTLLARLLISKMDTAIGYENFEDVVKQVDKSLVKLLRNAENVQTMLPSRENPCAVSMDTFVTSKELAGLSRLAYDLRRHSRLMSTFNSSPDEISYCHHTFLKCNSELSCLAISPHFYRFSEKTLIPVPFEESSLQNLGFFVLDCLDQIVIYNHFTNSRDGIPLHPSLNDPESLAARDSRFCAVFRRVRECLINERPIYPRIIITQSGHSQARYIFSKMETTSENIPIPSQKTSNWLKSFFRSILSESSRSEISYNHYYDDIITKMKNSSLEEDA